MYKVFDKQNSKFAPSGYGLGDEGTSCSDPNVAIDSGFYSLTGGSAINVPTGVGHNYGPMMVARRGKDNIEQEARFRRNTILRNSEDGGVTWSEWEYTNPPLVLGAEYRTTERWQGKPVYAMCVNCGILPDSTVKHIENVLPFNITMISLTGFGKSSSQTMCIPNEYLSVGVNIEWGYIIIETSQNMSAYTESYITFKYIKN